MKPSKYNKLNLEERRRHLKEYVGLTDEDLDQINPKGGLNIKSADHLIENVVGLISIPIAIVPGLIVNGKEYYVPMVTEQKRTINMANIGIELVEKAGGFVANSTEQIMVGQIQLLEISNYPRAYTQVMEHKKSLLELANTQSSSRKAVDLQMRQLQSAVGKMAVVEILVNVRDSMGANIVDSMVETIAPTIQDLTGGRVNLRILSNLATKRTITVKVKLPSDIIDNKIANDIVEAYVFAFADPYRAATHNKGIMNGVTAVLLATNNDTRAVEAGAHAYAAVTGKYVPLSNWFISNHGDLEGELTMPMALGIIGGSTASHPTSKLALKILGVESAAELGMVTASMGLACNLGALYKLVTEGIKSIS